MEQRFGLCVLDGGEHAWLNAPLPGLLHDAAFDNRGLWERLGGREQVLAYINQLRESACRTCEHKRHEEYVDRFHRLLVCTMYCGGACGDQSS